LHAHGKETAAFEVNQVGRHHDKLARHLDVQRLEGLHELQILLGDPFEGNVVDIHLVPFDQIKKQIQRAFKNLEFNLVVRGGHEAEA
jgi:hypothetical protein